MDAFGYDEDDAPPPPPLNPIATVRAPSTLGREEQVSPARANREPAESAVQPDYPYTSTAVENEARHALGYASFAALRDRIAATMVTGRYRAPGTAGSTTTTTETIGCQTDELPVKDAGVGVSDSQIEGERVYELQLGLCAPHDLPLMAVAQLLEAERRLADLLNRLESEIVRAEAQEERRRLRQLDEEERAAIAEAAGGGSTAGAAAAGTAYTAFGRFETTDQWNARFAQRIDRRLRRRHGDIEGVTPAMFWHRTKTEAIASPPRTRMRNASPERARVAKFAATSFAPPEPGAAAAASDRRADGDRAATVGVRPSTARR